MGKAPSGGGARRLRHRHMRSIVVIRARKNAPQTTPAMTAILGSCFDGVADALAVDVLAIEEAVLSESIRCNVIEV